MNITTLIKAMMILLEKEFKGKYKNRYGRDLLLSPWGNDGVEYSNYIFTVRSYTRYDKNYPNFECGALKVWWYKSCQDITKVEFDTDRIKDLPGYFNDILEQCIDSLENDIINVEKTQRNEGKEYTLDYYDEERSYEGREGEVVSQALYDENDKLVFIVHNLKGEDSVIGKNLFDVDDFVKAVQFGIDLGKKGYDSIELNYRGEMKTYET